MTYQMIMYTWKVMSGIVIRRIPVAAINKVQQRKFVRNRERMDQFSFFIQNVNRLIR